MKLYCFQYNCGEVEVMQYLKKNTGSKMNAFLSNDMCLHIKGLNIKLQKKKMLQHPLQRVFVGEVQAIKDGTVIVGGFKFPIIMSLFFALLTMVLLYGNIQMIFSNIEIMNKIICNVIFLCMYAIIVLLFVTGKTFYKKQEADVIKFLQTIQEQTQEDGAVVLTNE